MLSVNHIVISGVMATIAMDVWQIFLRRVFHTPATQWGLIGRWVAHMPRGRFVHQPIGATPAVRGDVALGWTVHYVVGLIYAFAYAGVLAISLHAGPSWQSALGFGLATVVIPWFVMQPGLGLGIMARLTPNATRVRLTNLSVHSIFGLSLYPGSEIAKLILAT